MRRLTCIAAIALAASALVAACEAPVDETEGPAAAVPDPDPNAFRADADRAYTGEWAASNEGCNNQREIWTIEENRMGMRRQRFCVFERVFTSTTDAGQGWSASARCVAEGRQSHDFVFFRVDPNQSQMRVTINDGEAIELVRCPMRT